MDRLILIRVESGNTSRVPITNEKYYVFIQAVIYKRIYLGLNIILYMKRTEIRLTVSLFLFICETRRNELTDFYGVFTVIQLPSK